MDTISFKEALGGLNEAQKRAVTTTEGPVMVVAGPGTGKTQVLALRIAYILENTDTPASGILSLTFTRSGVTAMRKRLEGYMGTRGRDVKITTFHSFAIELIEKYFHLLDFVAVPKLLTDHDAVFLVDELLHTGDWEYLRPHRDPTKYFKDLKSLISLLKRERITASDFLIELEKEITVTTENPDNISSRGKTKGNLKADALKKIEGLERTKEVVRFFEQYEVMKRERGFMDYDDVLEYSVYLVQTFEDVCADIRENFLYVLVDEHQDSSGIQNAFLKAVWADVEKPNIFVVGDDRQLIYGFSGANMDYFSEFKTCFGNALMITLTENYRSTQAILSVADDLLKSTMADGALRSNRKENEAVVLSEFAYARDEIIGAGLYFKSKIQEGVPASSCALLVPKNRQVKSAVATLRTLGVPVVSEESISLLDIPEAQSFLRILKLMTQPYTPELLAEVLLDKTSNVPPLMAHGFIKEYASLKTFSLETLVRYGEKEGLFSGENPVSVFGTRLQRWIQALSHERISHVVSVVGNELLIDQSDTHESLVLSVEVVRSFIHASMAWEEKFPTGNLSSFIDYFSRLTLYGSSIEVASFSERAGVRVMTLHKSKGLEYDHVWIAHMNQETFMKERPQAFMLPESIKARLSERDSMTAKRELYVAITRAKVFCTMSYAQKKIDGQDMTLLHIIEDLPRDHIRVVESVENESRIMKEDIRLYTSMPQGVEESHITQAIVAFVQDRFSEMRISVSMLNNFFECPWTWYFRNFLKLPEVKSVSLALGSTVHETIELILKSPELPSRVELEEKIESVLLREGVRDAQDKKRLSKEALAIVLSWVETAYPLVSKDYTSERSISYRDPRFPDLTMFGKIDLTERFPDGSMTVTDFKTGSSKSAREIEKGDEEGRLTSYMRQLAMYSYLVFGAEQKRVTESRLLFLEAGTEDKNAVYKTQVGEEEIELLVRDIDEYQNLLTSGEWIKRPCYTKTYGTKTECPYCARMKRITEKGS